MLENSLAGPEPTTYYELTVTLSPDAVAGDQVVSADGAINCTGNTLTPTTCTASYPQGASIVLTVDLAPGGAFVQGS